VRHTFWLLIVLAGTDGAQWRRFGEGRQAVAPSSLARGMLAAHNTVRARVGIAPLAWSDRLAARSQDWAATDTRKQFVHRPNSTYGENLFEISGATASAAQVVNICGGRWGRRHQAPRPHIRAVHGSQRTRKLGHRAENALPETGGPFGWFAKPSNDPNQTAVTPAR
jgi:hypothetical protein